MMLVRLTAAVSVAMTMACAPAPAAQEPVDVPPPSDRCDASQAQSLIGQPASSDLAGEAQRLSGAAAVRWLRPGQMVTMEYRGDRLNIELDAQNRVVAIRCG